MTDEDLLNEMEAAFDEDDDDDDGAADESTPSNGAAAASSTTPVSSSSGTPRQTVQVSSNFGVVLPPSGDGDDDDFGMPKSKRARTIQDVDDPTVSRQSSTAEEEEDEEGDVYINGINVVTGELIENEQRERGRYVARTAPNSRATKLAYGSYQGLELSTLDRFTALGTHLGLSDVLAFAEAMTDVHMGALYEACTVPSHHENVLLALSLDYRMALCSNFTHAATARAVLRDARFDEHLSRFILMNIDSERL